MYAKFYHTPEGALLELERRQKLGVQEKVQRFWASQGKEMPKLPSIGNMAVFARQLATARFEDLAYRELALGAGFAPTWWEYTSDQFTHRSPLKRSYMHPGLCVGRDKNGLRFRTKKLARMHDWERRELREIQTREGVSLVDWHHAHRDRVLGENIRLEVPIQTYPLFLSLFVAHGVLFEDYHGGESGAELDGFTVRKFEPAWHQVHELIGFSPIVVSMPWSSDFALYPATGEWEQYGVVERAKVYA